MDPTQLCSVSSEVLRGLSIDSLSRRLASFAPVNFRRHKEVRTILLGHFTKMAEESSDGDHTLTVRYICKELQKDEDSRFITKTALRCMLASMHLACPPSELATERDIIALLRREKPFSGGAAENDRQHLW